MTVRSPPPVSTRTIHSSTSTASTQGPGRNFPNPVAVFSDRFCFTTLERGDVMKHQRSPFVHPNTRRSCHIFTLDDEMAYTAFAKDHGPLNLAFTYSACLAIHDKMIASELKGRPICLYTSPDAKAKSNMALMVALYHLIVRHESPWQCFMPIANFEVMPFRDAGNGLFDHGLSIQDCLYGVHKATEFQLLDLANFDIEDYQYYEKPHNGDLNVLGPFMAFASPIEPNWVKMMEARKKTPGSISPVRPPLKPRLTGNHAFKSVLEVFRNQDVGLVVRLNDELYDKRHFVDANIDHTDMYFDDGSNPSDDIIREFIALAERYITAGKMVAVHCKAGLGRTGVLIGAYLIYKYSFSAQEVIGYMRIVRPGMVVGPQQQFMLLNQMKWAGWAARDELLRELGEKRIPVNPLATPPAEDDAILPTLEHPPAFSSRKSRPRLEGSPKRGDAAGQPRKALPIPLEHAIDIRTPTPEPERFERDMREHPARPAHSSKDGSMRGTKRGATRAPLPTATVPCTPPRLGLDLQSSLERSPSIISVASANDRPRKRVNGSPLAIGLSSPPSSREASPDDAIMIETASLPVRVSSILRQQPSVPTLKTQTELLPPSPIIKIASAPTSRSFMPIRKSPLKEIHAIQAPGSYTSPSRIPRAVAKDPKEKKVARENWTPPRLMSMLTGMGRAAAN